MNVGKGKRGYDAFGHRGIYSDMFGTVYPDGKDRRVTGG